MARMHRPAGRRAAALLLALALAAAACGGDDSSKSSSGTKGSDTTEAPDRAPKKGGELTIGTESDVASLDVGVAAQPADKDITLGIFDPLMTWKDGKIVPNLAESLTPSEDLKTYEMTLRKGVTFH